MLKISIFLATLLAVGVFADWPQFQYSSNNQGLNESVFLKARALDTVLRFDLGKPIYAAPVIMGDTIYAAASDGRVYSIERKQGRVLWRFDVPKGVRATPAADGKRLYVGGRDGVLHALNRFTGSEDWIFTVDDTIPAEKEIQAHIKLSNGRLYIGAFNGKLYCLDTSGRKKWEFRTSFYIKHPPAIKDSFIVLGSMDEAFYSLMDKGDSCSLRWVNRISSYPQAHQTMTPRCAPLIIDTFIFVNYAEGELTHVTKVLSWSTGAWGSWINDNTNFNTTGFAAGNDGKVYCNIQAWNINPVARFLARSGDYLRYLRSNAATVVLGNSVVYHSSYYPTNIYTTSRATTTFNDSLRMTGYSVSSGFAASDSVLYFGTYEGILFGMGSGQRLATGTALPGELPKDALSIAPNPFNPATRLLISLIRPSRVDLTVLDIRGRILHSTDLGRLMPGPHAVAWEGKDEKGRAAADGLYLFRVRIDGQARVLHATLMK